MGVQRGPAPFQAGGVSGRLQALVLLGGVLREMCNLEESERGALSSLVPSPVAVCPGSPSPEEVSGSKRAFLACWAPRCSPAAEPPGCQAPFSGKAVARMAWTFMEHLLVPYGKDRLEGESEVCFHCFPVSCVLWKSRVGAGVLSARRWPLHPPPGMEVAWGRGGGIPPRNQIPLSQA